MRRLAILLPLLLAACHREPSFDERYDKAAKEIDARAKAMDKDIAESEKAAKAVGEAPPRPGTAIEPGGKIPRTEPAPLPDTAKPSSAPPSSGE